MKAATAIFLLAVLVLVVLIVVVQLVRQATIRRQPWSLEEHSAGGFVTIVAVKPNEHPLTIGAVAIGSPDFDYIIEELRAEGRRRVIALNNRGR